MPLRRKRSYRKKRATARPYRKRYRSGLKSNFTTTQKDSTRQYVYKKLPKGAKLKWKRYKSKVQAALESEQGHSTVLRNTAYTLSEAELPGTQRWCAALLYGFRGTNWQQELGADDIWNVLYSDTRLPYISTFNFGMQKLKFLNAVLDVTIHNFSVIQTEVDVYEVKFGRSSQTSLAGCLQANMNVIPEAQANVDPVKNETLDISDRGCTPFDLPEFVKASGMKIVKKTKYFIPEKGTVTHQMRDPGTHIMNCTEYQQERNGFTAPGMTSGLFIVAKRVTGAAPSVAMFELSVAATRTYRYSILNRERTYGTNRL